MSTLLRLAPLLICDDAEFREDGAHRYWLSRRVDATGPVGLFLGLNPSKAGAISDDHTVRKWKGFAKRWGWSGFLVGNLFTFIETKSVKLNKLGPFEVNDANSDRVLMRLIHSASQIVVCWGNNVPKHLADRVRGVQLLIDAHRRPSSSVNCFGLTNSGHPMHPLTLGYDTPLQPYQAPTRTSRRERE